MVKIAGMSSQPMVICGDFNAIHPDDNPDREKLIKGFERFSPDPAKDVERFIAGGQSVFPALEGLGFKDVIGAGHVTIPTPLISKDNSTDMRIDHIMVRDIKFEGGTVVMGDLTAIASDHRPVMVNLSNVSII